VDLTAAVLPAESPGALSRVAASANQDYAMDLADLDLAERWAF
jgi:hypothetical protein